MRKNLSKSAIIAALTIWSVSSVAQASALRGENESFAEALGRQNVTTSSQGTVLDERAPFSAMDAGQVQAWDSRLSLEHAFYEVRDSRFIDDKERPGFLRRLSWLFPDDGCFVRAEIAARRLEALGYPTPSKIFVFGELSAETSNHPKGRVNWWYHVVVGYRVDQEVIVFDPAVDPSKPLRVQDWAKSVGGGDENLQFSYCDDASFEPQSTCHSGVAIDGDESASIEQVYLNKEWNRQIELRRDPRMTLGTRPPWWK